MPPKIQARMLKLLELIEKHGANLGPPHTESIGNGLFEIRAKAKRRDRTKSILLFRRSQHLYPSCICEEKPKDTKERLSIGNRAYERGEK